ncbi:MAG: glutamate racemase [Ruminococcus sp.]|uniref:glutamate racemase n=1 Tax=Ruminococcus sp. TaxID=41978 RepID=UPI002873421B|nr:glutamate racemase [Ruminococcus sp.]MBQ3285643.1 glutamate racemase [Ruminococcus sp.]
MNSKLNAIGIFDSGLGGLTAVREIQKIMPNEDIVYFGDTGRVPYGSKSREAINKYARQDARFLKKMGVKLIVAACGTVSSVAPDLSEELGLPYTGVVYPTCFTAAQVTKNGKIGVIGTAATINSHSYKRRIQAKHPEFEVLEQHCQLFVSFVENGLVDPDDELVQMLVRRYMAPFKESSVDTIILGCTHFPLLAEAIQREMGENVTLIDSGKETAIYTKKILDEAGLLRDDGHKGEAYYYVSDTPADFEKFAGLFLQNSPENRVEHINIEEY